MRIPFTDPIFMPSPLEQAVYIGLMCAAVALLYLWVAFMVWSLSADAVSLSISGHASGQGLHMLNVSGESLNASLWQNGSGWNLTLEGMP